MSVATVTLASGQTVKLGRVRPKARTLMLSLSEYIDLPKALGKLPDKVDYGTAAKDAIKEVLGNDQYGDCVIAGKMHSVGIRTAYSAGKPAVGTTNEAVQQYHQICGPGDNGCVITDVLDFCRTRGLTVGGVSYRIGGYVGIDWTNKDLVRTAIALFGPLTLGINLPGDWTTNHGDWGPSRSRIVGGHDVCVCGYDERGVQICTWGGVPTILWEAFTSRQWLEECFAVLAPDWFDNRGLSPLGLDVSALQRDLDKLHANDIPPLPEPGPVPVPPGPPVPVPPVPMHPTLNITLTGQVPSHIFGHETLTLTGTATPARAGALPSDWLEILKRLIALINTLLNPPKGA